MIVMANFDVGPKINMIRLNGVDYKISSVKDQINIKTTNAVADMISDRTHITRVGWVYAVNFGVNLNRFTSSVSTPTMVKIIEVSDPESAIKIARIAYSTCTIMNNGKNQGTDCVRECYFDGTGVYISLHNGDSGWVFGNMITT